MVWARICHDGGTQLKIVQGTLNAVKYSDDILDLIVLPFLQQLHFDDVCQHDNARVTWRMFVKTIWTRITSVFFFGRYYHRICHQLNIYGMNLPPSKSTGSTTVAGWRNCTRFNWNNIQQDFIQRLIGYMRRRCEAVVAARGGHTRYWTPQTSILHYNFCLSMIVLIMMLRNFVDIALLVIYAHMNLNTLFVHFFPLYKKHIKHQTLGSFLLLTSI